MRIPVLMYHDITENGDPDLITIRKEQLDRQLQYIHCKGYSTISLSQFYNYLVYQESLPPKPILLTFDDGYKSNYHLLYPLLQKYKMKAAIFLVGSFVKTDFNAATTASRYLHLNDIRQMDENLVDYGLHSYSHKSYADLNLQEIETDISQMQERFQALQLNMVPLFAYPYGAFFRKDPVKMEQLQQVFDRHHIAGAFRIGNRLNALPLKKKYQIQRIDVQGKDSFFKFRGILRFGRKWIL